MTEVERPLDPSAHAWRTAQAFRADLANGRVPPTGRVWDVRADPGEAFFFDLPATYARFYGQSTSYTQHGGFFFGSPGFVAGGLAATALVNRHNRRQAQAAAAPQWREVQHSRVLVSDRRLVCHVNGGWLDFALDAVVGVQIDLERWAFAADFGSRAVPLLLTGLAAPVAAVVSVFAMHGPSGVAEHPALRRLGAL